MTAANTSKAIVASRFGYPFKDKQGQEITDPQAFYGGLRFVQGGHYLLGAHGFFHGGIHIDRSCEVAFSTNEGVRCLADGEVIAYRINRRYYDATPGTEGAGPNLRPYSTGFVLVRHCMQAPPAPAPAKPAPMDNPGADIRNWGTTLYAAADGHTSLAWLPHGTPLTVEIGREAPGQRVRVLDIVGSGLPREGWIQRTWLALDPMAGAGMSSVFGGRKRIDTFVHRGDSVDPKLTRYYARNRAEQDQPAPPPAPSLTLYTLYMHVADYDRYTRHGDWSRCPWWPNKHYRAGTKARDRPAGSARKAADYVGLNVRQAPGKSPILGVLARGSVVKVGESSPDGKWARIAQVIEGGIEPAHVGGAVSAEAVHGWVFLPQLDSQAAPSTFDSVVVLETPHPVKQGDVLGYLGEDVASRARPIANQPASRRLLHLEAFSGDDVPGYLAASRQWARRYLPDSQRSLLMLREGDALLDAPGGKVAFTINWNQVLPLAAMEAKEVGGVRWREVSKLSLGNSGEASGWIEEKGRLVSPWEWPGFEVVDETHADSGGMFDDIAAWAGYIRKEAPHPEETPFYKALRKSLDANGDGQLSEQELDAALRNSAKTAHVGRIIARHSSEWAMESAKRQNEFVRSIAELLGLESMKAIEDETPRAFKLPWWEEVAGGVHGFPQSPRVYHFHPGGLAMPFGRERNSGWVLGNTSERYESGGKGPGLVSSGRGDWGGVSYGVYQMSSRMGVVQDYVARSAYSAEFAGLVAATAEFNRKWGEIAAKDPLLFRNDQHLYIKRTHYDVQRRLLTKSGFALEHSRAAIHDMVWSTSVQFGAGTQLIVRATKNLTLATATDEEIIRAVQDYKIANNSRLFARSPNLQPGLLARAKDEKERLLKLERIGVELEELHE